MASKSLNFTCHSNLVLIFEMFVYFLTVFIFVILEPIHMKVKLLSMFSVSINEYRPHFCFIKLSYSGERYLKLFA